ncbi:MAG: hypothetical protein OXC30_06550 [Alphaproteobacteria bacterium]|nr:hypothetical protein [Alphaproteobacteria bacterium]
MPTVHSQAPNSFMNIGCESTEMMQAKALNLSPWRLSIPLYEPGPNPLMFFKVIDLKIDAKVNDRYCALEIVEKAANNNFSVSPSLIKTLQKIRHHWRLVRRNNEKRQRKIAVKEEEVRFARNSMLECLEDERYRMQDALRKRVILEDPTDLLVLFYAVQSQNIFVCGARQFDQDRMQAYRDSKNQAALASRDDMPNTKRSKRAPL